MVEIICEIGLQHDGSLRDALAFVRACAKRGVDVCKFQSHLGDANAHFRKGTEHHFPQDESRFRYWQRTGFQQHEWERIKQECDDCGVEFLCTPFSVAAAEMLNPLVKRWKIGSGNVNDEELRKFIRGTKKKVVISNGMDSPNVGKWNAKLLACRSAYPTEPHEVPIDDVVCCVDTGRYCHGLSDHSGTIWPAILAAHEGAEIIEVHVCWSKEQGGPDVESAITIEQLGQLVEGVRYVERMQGR